MRTCQRLERSMGLPVHRLDGSPKAHVFALSGELDVWLAKKADERKQQKRMTPWLRMVVLAAGAVVLAVAAALISARGLWKREPGPWPAPGSKSVAVLPFTDLSPDPGWTYVAEGVSEAIRNSFSRLRGLRVPGRDSTLAAKDSMPDVREVGRLLGVESVLDGTVQVLGGRLRVSARLVNAGDGRPIWSGPYDKRPEDILGIQDDIAWSVLTHLKVKLRGEEEKALHKRPTENGQAYEAYLKGLYMLGHPRPEAPDAALGLFEEALRGDAGFAAARAGIAAFYLNQAAPALRPLVKVDPRALSAEMSQKARAALSAALKTDPDLAEARALDAAALFWFEWDWGKAEKEFRRALELRPGDTETRGAYAVYLLSMNRLERAREEIGLALAADPLSSLLRAYSLWIDLSSGRTKEALEEFERIVQREPGFELAYTGAALTYLRQGDAKKAEETLRKAYSYPQQVPGRLDLALAACYLKRGDRQGVAYPWGSLAGTGKRPPVSPVLMALAAAEQGDLYAAFDWLERARRERDPQMPFVRVYAEGLELDLVRNPRFVAFLGSLGPTR
ncbi:MAG TPA: tetratricopeptide repeat protein [Acidobacteriota bacterium]|nr:tetratricopeptide repeat protein [Acidobacteriota bacterium]